MILKYVFSVLYKFIDHFVGFESLTQVIELMVFRDVMPSSLVPMYKTTHSHISEDHHD